MEAASGTRNRNRDGNSGRLQPQLQRRVRIFFLLGGTGSLERGSGESRLWGMWRRTPGLEKGRTKFCTLFSWGFRLAVWETDMGWK